MHLFPDQARCSLLNDVDSVTDHPEFATACLHLYIALAALWRVLQFSYPNWWGELQSLKALLYITDKSFLNEYCMYALSIN